MAQTEQKRSPDQHTEPRNDREDTLSDTDSCDYENITVVVAKKGELMLMSRKGEELQATHELLLMGTTYEGSSHLRQEVCESFGIVAHTYITLSTSIGDGPNEYCYLINILEVIGDPCQVDEAFEWVDWKKLGLKFRDVCPHPEVARFLQSYLSNKDVEEVNLSLRPWHRVGFFSSFLPRLCELIEETELEQTGRAEQVHLGSNSTILKVPTNQGSIFVKVGFTGNGEPRITKAINELFPNETPRLLAVDEKLEVMLLADHGQSLHNKHVVIRPDEPQMEMSEMKQLFESVMMEWARLQIESIGKLEDLMAKGVPVFGRSHIWEAYAKLVSYMKETKLDMVYGKVFAMEGHLEKTFDAWDKFNLPDTLVHGDLHNSNVAQPGGPGSKIVFFDWDCAFIGHPFLDLHHSSAEEMLLGEDKYLLCWVEYGSLESLKQLLLMTTPVRYLIEAFVDSCKGVWTEEERKEWVSYHLEKVVESLEKVDDSGIGETMSG